MPLSEGRKVRTLNLLPPVGFKILTSHSNHEGESVLLKPRHEEFKDRNVSPRGSRVTVMSSDTERQDISSMLSPKPPDVRGSGSGESLFSLGFTHVKGDADSVPSPKGSEEPLWSSVWWLRPSPSLRWLRLTPSKIQIWAKVMYNFKPSYNSNEWVIKKCHYS